MESMPSHSNGSEQPQDASLKVSTGLLWLFVASAIYLLSAGPALWFYQKVDGTGFGAAYETFLQVVYWPIEWLFDCYPGMWPLDVYDSYLSLWYL